MQEPTTGEMIQLNEGVDQNKVDEGIKEGLCILRIDEIVNVKNQDMKVQSFDKKGITLEFITEGSKSLFKVNEKLAVKQGSFAVESFELVLNSTIFDND